MVDKSKDFANGFKIGVIWETLRNGRDVESVDIHNNYISYINRLCRMFYKKANIVSINNEYSIISTKNRIYIN